jgi:4-amino-4-deoxy-L-arabinose transferase-like glycosyltransferase
VPVAGEPFTRRDLLLSLALMAVGFALRVALWSGYGLGDDPILRNQIVSLHQGHLIPDNQGYRVTWWLPTLISTRFFGITEGGLIWPITLASALGIGAVYAIGHQLYGRVGAVIAALLLLVHPFDVAWATTFASDFICSVTSALAIWCALRATSHPDIDARRRAWVGAVIAVIAAYHTKVSGAALVLPIAAIVFMRRRDLGRELWTAVIWGAVLGGLMLVTYWALSGNPLAPLALEVRCQGLIGEAAKGRIASRSTFEIYPRLLFLQNVTGDFFYGLYPHLLVLLVVAGLVLRLRTSPEAMWWLAVTFLVMELNVQRANGEWVAGFRNVRHLHGIVYPMVLVIAGYLTSMRARWPRVTTVLIAVLLAGTVNEAVVLAGRLGPVFGDRRTIGAKLLTLPPGTITGDVAMHIRWELDNFPLREGWKYVELTDNANGRKSQIEALTEGYVITGTGQEPFYGCPGCIVRAAELPPDRFELLFEAPGPDEGPYWRPERARIWKVRPPAAAAGSGD